MRKKEGNFFQQMREIEIYGGQFSSKSFNMKKAQGRKRSREREKGQSVVDYQNDLFLRSRSYTKLEKKKKQFSYFFFH